MRLPARILVIFILFIACSKIHVLKIDFTTEQPKKFTPQQAFDLTRAYHQVTTHPDVDAYPAISPDGQWMAFSSRRSGNMDIWIKPIRGGSAVQITTHRADDLMPSWSPDSKKLVFVSYREDAAGDLWLIPLKKGKNEFSVNGKPLKLTSYLGMDITPVFSPDGKYIAFTSDREGGQNIYLYRLKNKHVFKITEIGGIHPTWSPDGNRLAFVSFKNKFNRGQIFVIDLSFKSTEPEVNSITPVTTGQSNDIFPCWSPTKNEIYFNHYDQNTNNDGQITPDDKPGLWKIIIEPRNFDQNKDVTLDKEENESAEKQEKRDYDVQEMQLIPILHYDYFPVCGRDSLFYFISDRSGNDDIWSVPVDGIIPRQDNGFLQYQFALNYFPLASNDLIFKSPENPDEIERLLHRLLAFQRVIDFYPEENTWVGWSLYEIGRTYIALDQQNLAKAYFQEIINQFINFPELVGKAELRLFELNFSNNKENLNLQIEKLSSIRNRFQNVNEVAAEAQLFTGEVYFLSQKYAPAIESLEELIINHFDQEEKCVLAQLLLGDIYAKFGQTEEVVAAFLRIIRNYPLQQVWVDSALSRILSLEKSDDFYLVISNYRNMITRYKQYPRLAARSQLKIGEEYLNRKDDDAAIEELSLVSKNYPDQREELARAELMLAEVFFEKGEDLRAIHQYKKVITEFGDVQGGLYVVQAKEQLLAVYLNTGRQFLIGGDIKAANLRYRDAIEIFPRNLEAHRGYVATMYALGQIDPAIQIYQNLNTTHPDNEVVLYVLGLCYSYKATEISDRTNQIESLDAAMMKKSNELIKAALSKNYRLVQAYLTLSYNYESIEKYESALKARKRGFLVSLIKTTVAPVKSVVNWITFRKEKPSQHWFEQAIDALTTAIALNDENQNPTLESELALNLAGNYYNLGEFGIERAYHYYHIKLQCDSTFTSKKLAAEVYKRMGHCALVVEDFKRGPNYLKRSMNLYRDLDDKENWLLNIKRLALLYQLAGDYDQSVEYFKIAAEKDEEARRFNQQLSAYRNIAYNYQLLNDEEGALNYARRALDLIRNEKVAEVKAKPNWIKIGILGIEFPVWNLGQIGVGASTAAEGFTTDEEKALLYTIIGQAALEQRSIPDAINFLHKKIEIYRKRKDNIAEAIFLNNIGYLYYWDFNYTTAWEFFEKSLHICKQEGNIPGTLINILNLASLSVIINKLNLLQSNSMFFNSQDHLLDESSIYLTSSLEYIHDGLSLYTNELIGFLHEKAQLYNLLGNLHYLKNAYLADSLKDDQKFVIQQQINRLQDLAIADSCYEMALELTETHNYRIEQISILQNIGYLSFDLGDIDYALEQFLRARELSLQLNLSNWLWRIDFALGQILNSYDNYLSESPSERDAYFYLNEAISVVEQNALQLQTYRVTPFYVNQVRQLYETAIDYHIAQGKYIHALRLTEQFRGKQYLDIIGSHRLELKKERHKIHLGNARFLIQEINALENKIRMAEEKEEKNETDILSWKKEKRDLEKEYLKLIEKLKEEDPELESFVHVEPVTFAQIQNILDPNSIVLDYFISQQHLYIWTIISDSVDFFKLPIQKSVLENQIETFSFALANNKNSEQIANAIWQILIQPVVSKLISFDKIIIIPDGLLGQVPFSYLINFVSPENHELKDIIIVPGLSNYFYSYQKRKIRGTKVFLAGGELDQKIENLGYNTQQLKFKNNTPSLAKNDVKDYLQKADLIYLDIEFNPNEKDPLISSVALRLPRKIPTFQIREFYNLDLQSFLVIINGIENKGKKSYLTLQKALLYAGTPSLILSLWNSNNNAFWDYFFEALLDYSIAEAFLRAQVKMHEMGFDPKAYAGYQLIGFEGMNDKQEQQFAEERFITKVILGNKYAEEHAWVDAIKNYEQALVMAKKRGDVESINNLYQLLIESAANGGFYDKAIDYQLEFVELAQANNDIRKVAEGYNYLVYFYTESNNYDQAVFYQNEYLKLAEQYDLRTEVASSYRKLGLVYERGGNFEKAIDYFSRAVRTFREIGDSLNVAICLKDRGRVYLMNLDNYSKAIENQELAVKIFQRQNNIEGLLDVIQNIGVSHERLANYQVALNYQLQALDLAEQLGSAYWIALSQHLLSNISWKMGNYEQAIRYQKQAQETFKELNNVKLQSVGLATEGLIFMSLGNIDAAINKEQQALELAQKIDSRQDMANIHKNLGLMYRAQNKLDEALAQFQYAIQIDEAIDSKRGLGYGFRDLGSIYFQQGRINDALTYFHKALKISQEILDGRNEVQCLYEIGKTYLSLENIKIALDTLVLAAEKARKLFIPDVEWRSHRLIGQLYRENKDLAKGIEAYQKALRIIENMRSQIKVEEYKAGFIDDKLDVYYDLVNLYLQLDQPGKALEIVERAKSRNFIDLLANRDIKFRGTFSEQKLNHGKLLQNEISRIQNEISGLIIKGSNITAPEREKLNSLNKQIQDLKQKYEKFLIELKEQNAELAEMVTVAPKNIDTLKSILPDSVIVLVYFYTENKLFTWAVTNQWIVAKQRDYQADVLVSQVGSFRKSLEEHKSIISPSQGLYSLLIAYMESEIAQYKHIVIIPHGILHYLPFAALMDGDQRFLIEEYSLSLAPSLAVLDICMMKGQTFISEKEWMPQILALGNPDLNNPQYELPFAEKEIESVQLLYPDVTSYLKAQATEMIFKQSCEKNNMILLSCHGEFDAVNPLFSSLLLTPDQENDGRLQAHEVFGLNMNAYLVAMSACETGLAKIGVGDEVIGLSRSFIYAGSSSLLSSLWKVDDLATAVLIKRFFRYLKEGDSRAKALQKAINLVRSQINVHPVYWAAFNITGDFR